MAITLAFGLTFGNAGMDVPFAGDTGFAHAESDESESFITTWQTTEANESIIIPTGSAVGEHTIDWGDGTTPTTLWFSQTHTYENPGNYTVSITGDFKQILLHEKLGNAKKILSIDNWGNMEWSNMDHAFAWASNMTYKATDVPDLSSLTNLQHMFYHAESFNGNISGWDVSSVTNVKDMFSWARSFNQDLPDWNVSSVEDMHGMFYGAESFNGNISGWDTSSATDMSNVFTLAESFNGNISGWDTSSATTMKEMFFDAASFNGDISGWDVSGVTDMKDMFSDADAFDQNLGKWYIVLDDATIDYDNAPGIVGSISAQNSFLDGQNPTYSVVGSGGDSDSFEMDGSDLKLKVVPTKKSYTVTISSTGDFGSDNSRTLKIDVPDFPNEPPDVDAGTDQTVREGDIVTLSGIATDGDGDSLIYEWSHDSDLAISIADATLPSTTFTAPAVDADTTVTFTLSVDDATNTPATDQVAITITNTITNNPPTVDAGTSQTVLEGNDVVLNGTASDSDDDRLTYLWTHDSDLAISLADTTLPSTTFTAPAVDADTTVTFTLTVSDGSSADVTDTASVTIQEASDFVTTWETSESGESITIPASGTYDIDWGDGTTEEEVSGNQTHTYDSAGSHTVRISDGIQAFAFANHADAPKLVSIDQWGYAEWVSMHRAFHGASNMTYNASDVPDLSGVTDAKRMFGGAAAFDGDLSGWDVSNVNDMSYMFKNARSFDSDLSSWNVSGATYTAGMFWNAYAFDSDLSGWDVSGVTIMANMFNHAYAFDSDLSGWDVSGVDRMNKILHRADAFGQNLGKWYITLDDYSIRSTDVPGGTVGTLSPQNQNLDGNGITYGIGTGGHSEHFEVDDRALRMKSAPDGDGQYTVNVTSSGGYGTDNSYILTVTVSDSAAPASAGLREATRVSLSSTTAGTIEVSWNAPFEDPKDYRVKWAKTGDDYLSLGNLDGNAFPTAPGHTIADLEEGEEYKVKVRARYHDGGPGPWSGEFTIQVASTQ